MYGIIVNYGNILLYKKPNAYAIYYMNYQNKFMIGYLNVMRVW